VGAQGIATVETDSSSLSIEVAEPGVLVKLLVAPGQHVEPGSALAVLAAPGEVIEDIAQLMEQLGLAVAPEALASGAHLRTVAHDDPLGATTWPPFPAEEDPWPVDGQESAGQVAAGTGEIALSEAGSAAASVTDAAATGRVVGWVDVVAQAVVTELVSHQQAVVAPAELRQVRLRALVTADRLLAVIGTVDSVSLIGLLVKAVAVTCRQVPLQPEVSTLVAVAVQRRVPAGTIAPVLHVANLMTASLLTSTIADLDTRAAQGRFGSGDPEPASVLVVDMADHGVAEGAMDATATHPAVVVIGQARAQSVVEDGALVPAQAFGMTLSFDANRIDIPTAARWFALLNQQLEQPLRFLT
jgi:pyruvate dehydrogenase E2 component (dihydrolipoamide acetyltransferase)